MAITKTPVKRKNALHHSTKKWLSGIEDRLMTAQAAGEAFGACELPDPNGGPQICTQMDEATCKSVGGFFRGGDCG